MDDNQKKADLLIAHIEANCTSALDVSLWNLVDRYKKIATDIQHGSRADIQFDNHQILQYVEQASKAYDERKQYIRELEEYMKELEIFVEQTMTMNQNLHTINQNLHTLIDQRIHGG